MDGPSVDIRAGSVLNVKVVARGREDGDIWKEKDTGVKLTQLIEASFIILTPGPHLHTQSPLKERTLTPLSPSHPYIPHVLLF